jgi:rfaE bifunctional protein kinase chain/domain
MKTRKSRDRRSSPARGEPRPVNSSRATAHDRLVGLVRAFAGLRVAVLGDLVADEFVYGDIARISREAPVPILTHRKTVVVPGGGGNAVANLRALDARPLPVGVVGRDEPGRRLLEEFKRAGISRTGIRVEPSYGTPSKSRILAGGVHTRRQQIVRVDRGGGGGDLPRSTLTALRRALREILGRADGLLVADYGYGTATPELVAGTAAARSLPVLVDSRTRVTEFRAATGCTPNQEELERALGLEPLADRKAVETAGRRLLRRTGNKAVLVTRGAKGMFLFERAQPPLHIPAYGSDEVADVTGAGDTVIAVFTLALLAGAGFADAARLSNYAAGLVVMKAGTATVTAEELTAALDEDLGA